jgi:hypothetical protein
MQTISLQYSHYWILFFAALVVRILVFVLYVQHDERYRQPDSIDYHNASICLYLNQGMYRPDKKEYIFWRTPGYPFFLSRLYKLQQLKSLHFEDASGPQKLAIWIQIILNSFIPLLVLILAYFLTNSTALALIAAWISVFHIGFVLSSTYLLSEGLSLPFFLLFLVLWFAIVRKKFPERFAPLYIIAAALTLALFTWIRPMGQFVAVAVIVLYVLLTQRTLLQKLKHVALFAFVFWSALSPWYVRNYQLTNQFFFCPMLGAYLNTFNAPKIMRRLTGYELAPCATYLYRKACEHIATKEKTLLGTGLVVCREAECMQVAQPLLVAHLWWTLYDWFKEVCKTTFDLYSSQLVNYAKNCFKWDPIEEFLLEKWHDCLFFPMHWFMRLIAYTEVIFFIWLWIGLFGGLLLFPFDTFFFAITSKNTPAVANQVLSEATPVIRLWRARQGERKRRRRLCILWWQVVPLIWACVFMTGGFGYARLRLPIEALLIILSLTFWHWLYKNATLQPIIFTKN